MGARDGDFEAVAAGDRTVEPVRHQLRNERREWAAREAGSLTRDVMEAVLRTVSGGDD